MPEFLLADKNGMTTVVFSEKDKNQYIQKGYKLIIEETTQAINLTSNSIVNPNTMTVKELIEVLSVSRAIIKKLVDNRPYESIEKLVETIPEVSWTSYQLNFE